MRSARHDVAARLLLALTATGPVQCGPAADGARDEGSAPETRSGALPERAPAAPGEVVSTGLYDVTLLAVAPCREARPTSAAADRITLGARLRVESRTPDLHVTPRDVRLRSGGFVFESRVLTDAPGACAPLLPARRLGLGEHLAGFVVFEVPASRSEGLRLEYEPTRWGGGGHVVVALPDLAITDASGGAR